MHWPQELSKKGHAFLRTQLDVMGDYGIKVVRTTDGIPVVIEVKHVSRPKRAHPMFPVWHRTRIVRASLDAEGNWRLHCSCLWSGLVGMPCRHLAAVNGGAALEDCVLRWHNATLRGEMDKYVHRFEDAGGGYVGALMSAVAMDRGKDAAPEAEWDGDVGDGDDFGGELEPVPTDAVAAAEDGAPQGASGSQSRTPALVAPARVAAAKDYNETRLAVTQTAAEITNILSGYIVSGDLASQAVRTESSEMLATARAGLLEEVLQLVRASVNEHDGPFQALKSGAANAVQISPGNSSQLNSAVRAGNAGTKGY